MRAKAKLTMAAIAAALVCASAGITSATEPSPGDFQNQNVTITNGALGISTNGAIPGGTWPAQGLHLYRNDTSSVRFRLENSAGAADFTAVSGSMNFQTDNITRLRVMKGGDVGIGNFGDAPSVPAQFVHLRKATTGATRMRLENSEGFVEVGTDGGSYQMLAGGAVRMTVLSNGRVGIGTATPTQPLDVAGVGRVQILEITGGSDLSEQFNVTSAAETHAEPGMVVCIDPARPGELVVSSKPYDFTVAGIISGAGGVNSGMIMGQHGSVADGAHPVALTGRVYCYVDATTGAVQPGDMLTTSATPGHAMKVLDHTIAQGAIIGKAMTPLAAGEKGLVLVLVTLQ